jgi:FixJ family two-component response regulator
MSHLERDGKLIRTLNKESCNMQTKRHTFYIYNDKHTNKRARPPYKRWTEEEIRRIQALVNTGKTKKEIAEHFGASENVIKCILRKKIGHKFPESKKAMRGRMPYDEGTVLPNIKQRVETCDCCGRKKLVIEIEL